MIGRDELLQILPHRPPMLFVDRVLELVPGERATGTYRVTDEDCGGHFPGNPVMPGVKIAEAMAQVAAVIFLADDQARGQAVYLLGLDKVRFRKPVRPGDDLRVEVEVEQARRGVFRFRGRVTVDGARVAEGAILASAATG